MREPSRAWGNSRQLSQGRKKGRFEQLNEAFALGIIFIAKGAGRLWMVANLLLAGLSPTYMGKIPIKPHTI